jgi:acyl carrier protein
MTDQSQLSNHAPQAGADLNRAIRTILSDVLQIDIAPAAENIMRRSTEAWDSVNHLRLLLEIEEAFGITLSDTEWVDLDSLQDLETLLVKRGVTQRISPD